MLAKSSQTIGLYDTDVSTRQRANRLRYAIQRVQLHQYTTIASIDRSILDKTRDNASSQSCEVDVKYLLDIFTRLQAV